MSRVALAAVFAGVALSAACSLITSLDDLRGSADGAVDDASDAASDGSIVCEAGLSACNGTCLDTTSSQTNCGACGHDCLGQPCATGLCAPITLAQVNGSPHGIAVGGDVVYFTTYDSTGADGGVFRVSTDGGGLAQIAGGQNSPSILALVDGGGMYWTNAGYGAASSIMYAERDGGSRTTVASSPGTAFGIGVTDSAIFWTNSDKVGSIETSSLDGGNAAVIVSNRNTPSLLATDGVNVFWAEQSGSVMRSALDGSNLVTLVGNLNSVFGITIDATDVYFTDSSLGLVGRVPKNQGQLTKLATGQSDARCIAVDNGVAFWAAYANGAIRASTGTGQPREYAINQNAPLCVALDSAWVYWTDYGDGSVKKTPR